MIQTSTKSQIKLNRRGLTELVLACAFLSLLTFALWSWQNKGGYVTAMDNSAVDVEASLIPLIMRHPAIMLSAVVTEFVLLLAFVLAVVPITWWLRTDAVLASAQARAMTPLHWLGEKLHLLPSPAEVVEEGQEQGEYIITETGERVFVPSPNAEAEMELVPGQDVVMVEQLDGQLVAMVQQADGTMAPAQMQPKEKKEGKPAEQGDPNAPLLAMPEQTSDVLNFGEEEEEEDDSLAELVDIDDILNSAFDDESAIDPEREAISRSLDHVDIMDLLGNSRTVLATFQQ